MWLHYGHVAVHITSHYTTKQHNSRWTNLRPELTLDIDEL